MRCRMRPWRARGGAGDKSLEAVGGAADSPACGRAIARAALRAESPKRLRLRAADQLDPGRHGETCSCVVRGKVGGWIGDRRGNGDRRVRRGWTAAADLESNAR